MEKVELEDPRFTSQFMVYGTNQVEPRYILTSAVMERIMAFTEKFDTAIMLSFVDNTLFFAIENSEGVFSFPSGKLDAIEILEDLVEKVKTTLSIVDDLKLNNSYGQ